MTARKQDICFFWDQFFRGSSTQKHAIPGIYLFSRSTAISLWYFFWFGAQIELSLPEIKEGNHCSCAKYKAEIHVWNLRGPPGLDDYSISQCLKPMSGPFKPLIAYLNRINTWRMHCWEHDGLPFVQQQVWYGAFYSFIHNQLQNQTSFTLGKVCTPKFWPVPKVTFTIL